MSAQRRVRESAPKRDRTRRRRVAQNGFAPRHDLVDSFDDAWLRRFRRSLSGWYAAHARPLPWRRTRDAYRIWISEVMLQQTTVVAVVPYFERFLERFPTLHDLAAADEHDVLRLWEGLGYYSRARNLHRAAKQIVAVHGGQFPRDVVSLLKLPGIGRYTAGAIASFAFDLRAPIVEANTLRLYCRLLGYRGDPRSAAGQRLLWTFAEHILPRTARRGGATGSLSARAGREPVSKRTGGQDARGTRHSPGQFNQALMELGATVCSPTEPACDRCPVRRSCVAFAAGSQHDIPPPARRPEITDVTEVAAVVWQNGRCLLRRRPPGERWAGLWDFPRFEVPVEIATLGNRIQSGGRGSRQAALHDSTEFMRWLRTILRANFGLDVLVREELATLKHTVTRFRITLRCFFAEHRHGDPTDHGTELRWVRPTDLANFPLSTTGRKLAKLLPSARTRTLFGD
jgi:A/G-specific adenine glycosylase